METKLFEDEIALKHFLNDYGFRYGEIGCNDKYIIYFRDNKSGAPIFQGIFDSPISALRDLNTVVPQVKIPLDEIMIQLVLVFNPSDNNKRPIQFKELVCLSPYLYFKKKDLGPHGMQENTEGKKEKESN